MVVRACCKWIVINILRTLLSCIWFHLYKTRNVMIFKWSNWNFCKKKWRIELIVAAKALDELFKAVKSQSNRELACCRRNSFKWSVYVWLYWRYSSFNYLDLKKLLVIDKIEILIKNAHSGTLGENSKVERKTIQMSF